MMKVWGMISTKDESDGFDVILDQDWYVVLTEKGETRARFDPRDYTATELLVELEDILQNLRDGCSGQN